MKNPLKKRKNLLMYFILNLFFVLNIFGANYKIKSLDIDAALNNNGSMSISESVIYDAQNLNGIEQEIDYAGFGTLTIHEILVSVDSNTYETNKKDIIKGEDGQQYLRERIEAKFSINENIGNQMVNKGFTRSFGDYEISNDNTQLLKIRLYARTSNKSRKFIFKYTLSHGVILYNDIAQINRKFVGTNWDNIGNVNVKVTLPKQITEDKLYAFAHGPLTGEIDIYDGQKIFLNLNKYYTNDFVEANILFPRETITGNYSGPIKNEEGLEKILKEEEKLANKANNVRLIAKSLYGYFFVGIVIWLLVTILVIIFGNKKNKGVSPYGKYFRELPDNYTPAVAGTLVAEKMHPDDTQLLASLFDLVRKRYLQLETISGNTDKTILTKSRDTSRLAPLSEYETFLLSWYIDRLGNGERVILEDINNKLSKESTSLTFINDNSQWSQMVYRDLLSKNLLFEKHRSFIRKISLPIGIGLIFLAIIVLNIGGDYLGDFKIIFVVHIILGFIMTGYFKSKLRETQYRADAHERWESFKRFLIDYSRLEEAKVPEIHLWEEYFVYAVSLGVAEKVLKQFKNIVKNLPESVARDINMSYPLINRFMMNNNSYSNSTKMFRNATSSNTAKGTVAREARKRDAARSRSSSSSGRSGGGFSGGSSGGGGSRGGGRGF